MALVDIAAQAPNVSVQMALRLADRLVTLVRSAPHDDPAVQVEDDVFTPQRVGSARLPAVDLCEISIFQQLRNREEMMHRTQTKREPDVPEQGPTGLNARIGSLFRVH